VRVLLAGGTGFIGGTAAQALTTAGHQVTVLSRGRRTGPAGTESLIADRSDPAALGRALEGRRFDFTVDFTAYDAGDVERLLLVPYAALGRYVMISTGQVYLVTRSTSLPYREEDSEAPIQPEPPEGSPDHPEWRYGMGKRRAEGTLLSLRTSHGVRSLVLRLPVVIGEGDSSLRLWAYLERMRDGGPILLPDGGLQRLRFIDVADVARTVVWLVENPQPREAIYNLAQPDVVTLRDFLALLASAAGVEARFVEASWDEILAAGISRAFSPYSGPWVSVLDPSRAASALGFLGARSSEYLPRVARWHLENPPAGSHRGYEHRDAERELAARLARVSGV
jgi:nucleoside-diphosphate-sugar epimerase